MEVAGLSSGSLTSSAASPLVTSSSQDSKREKSTQRPDKRRYQNRTEDWLEETWCRKHEETRCMICQNVWRSSLKTSCKEKLQQQKQSALGSSSKESTHTTLLYGSRTTVASCGRVHTLKLSLDQLPCSSDKRSRSIHPRPETGTTTRIAEEETLKASAVLRPLLCLVKAKVNDLLADGGLLLCF